MYATWLVHMVTMPHWASSRHLVIEALLGQCAVGAALVGVSWKSIFCLLPSQSTTPSELHPLPSFSFTAILHSSSLLTMTSMVMNLSACQFT
jgi:hypothetical protein